jgi:hypothetical protein
LLLQNQTFQPIAPRQRVQGFSQFHQIDLAWPAREQDVLICAETKVTGAPAFGDTGARGAVADYSNRRKELKFATTDLKLYRRQQETVIEHWGVWRESAPPRTYLLWAARPNTPKDKVETLVAEAQALVNTYLDGAGVFAWQEADGTGYEPVQLAHSATVTSLDDVLHRVATIIKQEAGPDGAPPPAEQPPSQAVPTGQLPLEE